jgi:hypothetical protein
MKTHRIEDGVIELRQIAALYIDPAGPYPKLLGADACWPMTRDAKKYDGPDPVVAHPPCGPWGMLREHCKYQDPECAPRAFEQVRAFGGVLEHPAYSRIFRHLKAPFPGELPDAWGGRTWEVNQLAWRHKCSKPTWLYIVGVPADQVAGGLRYGGTATHILTRDRRLAVRDPRPEVTSADRSRSPVAFAEWLISLARTARIETRQSA